MNVQTIVVIMIAGICAAFIISQVIQAANGKDSYSCICGCDSQNSGPSCPKKTKTRKTNPIPTPVNLPLAGDGLAPDNQYHDDNSCF